MKITRRATTNIFLIFLLFSLIPSSSAEFKVTWYDCRIGLTSHYCYIDIQNLESVGAHFDLSLVLSDTNYNLFETDGAIYEWKAIETTHPVFVETYIEKQCNYTDNSTLEIVYYNCSYYTKIKNGVTTKRTNQWKETKMLLMLQNKKARSNYGNILIPPIKSNPMYDDLGRIETENGIKKFKVEWNTPLLQNTNGWGSSGKIAIFDDNTNTEYHPFFNATWVYKYNITKNTTFKGAYVLNDTNGIKNNVFIHALIDDTYSIFSISPNLGDRITVANESLETAWFNSSDCSGNSISSVYDVGIGIIFTFDGGNLNDCSGNSYTATLFNAPALVTDSFGFGDAYDFNEASAQWINTSTKGTALLIGDVFTLFAIINSTDNRVGTANTIMAIGQTGDGEMYLASVDNYLRFYSDQGLASFMAGNTVIDDGVPHMIFVVVNSSGAYGFVDNKFEIADTDVVGLNIDSTKELMIGRQDVDNSRHINGSIDEARIYIRDVGEAERTEIYQNWIGNRTGINSQEVSGGDTTPPTIKLPITLNDTGLCDNTTIRFNVSQIYDNVEGKCENITNATFTLVTPSGEFNISLLNDSSCEFYYIIDDIYTFEIGLFNITRVYANDLTGNYNETNISLTFNVTSCPEITTVTTTTTVRSDLTGGFMRVLYEDKTLDIHPLSRESHKLCFYQKTNYTNNATNQTVFRYNLIQCFTGEDTYNSTDIRIGEGIEYIAKIERIREDSISSPNSLLDFVLRNIPFLIVFIILIILIIAVWRNTKRR